ncbi:MAG: hypothetical protein H6600_08775 [Flavobacteriales bacterium]|nr:hypothetical protein [Flavobacteriales bacterium]MCB9196377.1 hypothetical protein [Flavobacteriales bacterium]MCB9198540.1 hypothetical protein [Flavobacteriales bacterium]
MKRRLFTYSAIMIGSLSLISGSCEKKEISCNDTVSTYETNIKPIIDANCIGCHKKFSTYAGLQSIINNGEFEHEVLVKRSMPQGKSLTMEELVSIKCWLDNGAAEK